MPYDPAQHLGMVDLRSLLGSESRCHTPQRILGRATLG